MKRALSLLAFVLFPGSLLIGGAVLTWRKRDYLACRLGFLRHDAQKELSAAGMIWRCRTCGKAAASLLELTDPEGEDRVSLDRRDQFARLNAERGKVA